MSQPSTINKGATNSNAIEVPLSLRKQLHEFRQRLWKIKSIEAVCGAAFGVLLGYLFVFACDRFFDTPLIIRFSIFLGSIVGCAYAPVFLHRWVWGHRRLEQLARLLAKRYPSLGDQMLGAIELAKNELELSRSRALCAAAIRQAADAAKLKDFREAVPSPRHRTWAMLAAAPLILAIGLFLVFPAAASNALSRFLSPWRPVERYTFTAIEKLPKKLVVAHGEPVNVSVRLLENSQWKPEKGVTQVGVQPPLTTELADGKYNFELAPQIQPQPLRLRVGDWRQEVEIQPMNRPELSTVSADVKLPDYLQRKESLKKDVRGGAISLVKGSRVEFTATANRDLAKAQIDGKAVKVNATKLSGDARIVDDSSKMNFEWEDSFGLRGQAPFSLSITALDDESPVLSCENLPRQKVILVSESLNFKVHALDDFGVKVVGMEWRPLDAESAEKPAQGEQVLSAGGSEMETLELAGVFCAEKLGIEPQPIQVRVFAEDYFPGRPRVYSSAFQLYVLSPDQHLVWITEQLSKWHRVALEVRDKEMQLYQTNQQLRMLSEDELDRPENRKRIEAQATGEQANARRLTGLVNAGDQLVREAMRNPEFGVGHLEKWAEMLQILKDISANRMPSVADLLKEAAKAPPSSAASSPGGPKAGQARANTAAPGGESKPGEAKPPVPTIVDSESSQQPAKPKDPTKEDPSESKGNPALRLPVTTIAGGGSSKPGATPAQQKLDEAVKKQEDLLAEFEKIADELNKILANLEGSTLVKRLKAASRKQYVIGGKIGEHLSGAFGKPTSPPEDTKKTLADLAQTEEKSSLEMSSIMDDMHAYFERRRFQRFKTVLDEMRETDVIGGLRQLGSDIKAESGLSMAQCEFWSDTFDRWADDLVDPANCGKCPGGKSKASLPPSLVLEALKILEAEVNLREETRVAEQARPAMESEPFAKRAKGLEETQTGLAKRIVELAKNISELPDGEEEFAFELRLLAAVDDVMRDASSILAKPDTGIAAIGAETEAIELLLQSKRINPKGGGGGGSSPGGGGGGNTSDAAIALVGAGLNEKEVREDRGVTQTTGDSGPALPEEFRAGLDQYFERLERTGGAR
jgi:hypothetical protein